jgi:NifB/MoaA-like Fe-S oxidoreductase
MQRVSECKLDAFLNMPEGQDCKTCSFFLCSRGYFELSPRALEKPNLPETLFSNYKILLLERRP